MDTNRALMHSAEKNYLEIQKKKYPGRGIVMGISADSLYYIQIYWIMGRSINSRNRIFTAENTTLKTEPADPKLLSDPSLVIYRAMQEWNNHFIVTNGDQTDTIVSFLQEGRSAEQAIHSRTYEPDAPNYTPRIAGIIQRNNPNAVFLFSIIKCSSPVLLSASHQFFYYNQIDPGIGYCVTTYREDGNPLPAFIGEPICLPLQADGETILKNYWEALDKENRISLAVKMISIQNGKSSLFVKNNLNPVQ